MHGGEGSQEERFKSHCDWIAGVRAQYQRQMQAAGEDSPDWLRLADTQPLHERFSDAMEFGDFEPPVYRSIGSAVSTVGSVDTDFDEPVYRSVVQLGDRASGSADVEDFEAVSSPVAVTTSTTVEAEWMRSMPPLVKRQRAFKF
eukprot:CAMPEP_0119058412 /NCGR_PEP_ID=MMETSP1178-20130426/2749_1 /TAXON_ID=33656 /ORGANISM="unid sp, Strain CCMP2000" /LENGTH=143 /DNA_ID=CAMNT_0007039347 /DNA_START=104 /DNA_END=535 /DNA_ORIENTATION=-